jgi:hypothetical protein
VKIGIRGKIPTMHPPGSLDCDEPNLNLSMVKARLHDSKTDKSMDASAAHERARTCSRAEDDEIDASLLEDSLAKTPWQRMQANDDALRFADSLRAAMQARNAKP